MQDLLDDLRSVRGLTADKLSRDRMTRHAVERILIQLVDLAVSVNGHVAAARLGRGPATYRDSFRLAAEAGLLDAQLADQLAPSSGLRNVLTHEYVEVDLQLVAQSVERALSDYPRYIRSAAAFLAAPPPTS